MGPRSQLALLCLLSAVSADRLRVWRPAEVARTRRHIAKVGTADGSAAAHSPGNSEEPAGDHSTGLDPNTARWSHGQRDEEHGSRLEPAGAGERGLPDKRNRVAPLAAQPTSQASFSSTQLSRRTGADHIPSNVNALIRAHLSGSGPARVPQGSFVARLPPGGFRGRPYVVRLPSGPPPRIATPRRTSRRVVLILPVKTGSARPSATSGPRTSGAGGPRASGVGGPRASGTGGPPRPTPAKEVRPPPPKSEHAVGDRKPSPSQRHIVVSPRKVYTLDDPRLRRSGIKGYGPPKPSDVINCLEVGAGDCYV